MGGWNAFEVVHCCRSSHRMGRERSNRTPSSDPVGTRSAITGPENKFQSCLSPVAPEQPYPQPLILHPYSDYQSLLPASPPSFPSSRNSLSGSALPVFFRNRTFPSKELPLQWAIFFSLVSIAQTIKEIEFHYISLKKQSPFIFWAPLKKLIAHYS